MEINRSKLGKRSKRTGKKFETDIGKYLERELKPLYANFRALATPRSGGYQLDWIGDIYIKNHPILENCFIECKLRKGTSSFPTWYKETLPKMAGKRWAIIIYKQLFQPIDKAIICIHQIFLEDIESEFQIKFPIIKKDKKDLCQIKLKDFIFEIKRSAKSNNNN